jgi:pantoate--beta-alanine ligase
MKAVIQIKDLREARVMLAAPFGFVPTMGYLHEGHLALVRRAREECASVGVSIFVNPTQFGLQEDLDSYPRDLDRDFRLLEAENVDLVWTPTTEDMYPEGFQTWVGVEELTRPLEGAHRPGHFRGVTTVVAKIFNAARPDRAYFGQKDAQQVTVIQCMVKDLDFPLEVVVCPTVRHEDGLAMSSRNMYLNPEQREAATVLYRSLKAAVDAFGTGERDADALRQVISAVLSAEPLARVEYISVADPITLEESSGHIDRALLSMAVYVGKTRLIDNMLVGSGDAT